MNHTAKTLVAAVAMTLAGCAVPPSYDQSTQYPSTYPSQYPNTYPNQYPNTYPSGQYPGPAAYSGYGYVDSVEVLPASGTQGVGIGAVGGAVVGGIVGNQIGHGAGRAAATVGGAVAGGVIGHQIEKHVRGPGDPAQYRYRIRMDDGSYQTYSQDFDAGVRAGDRVRVDAGRVYRL